MRPAEWIQRGGYKNAAGELCCGERDRFELTDADVKITAAGYFVVSTKETIPFQQQATPVARRPLLALPLGVVRGRFFAPGQHPSSQPAERNASA